MLIGLWRRPEAGGVTIEAAQFESTVAIVGDAMVEQPSEWAGLGLDARRNLHGDIDTAITHLGT